MNILPKISQLQVFIAIVRNGGFGKAAKSLNVTQPAITHSINELERSLGISLFVRKRQSVCLTKAGEIFSERAQFLIDTYNSTINDVKSICEEHPRQELSLGISSLSLFSTLSLKINEFQLNYPKVNIKVIDDELSVMLRMLRTGCLDFIIHPDSEQFTHNDLVEELLFETRACVLASIKSPSVSIDSITELKDVKWFLPKSKLDYYNNIDFFKEDKIKNESIVFHGGGIMSLLIKVNSNFITLAPEDILNNNIFMRYLKEVKFQDYLPDISYKIVYSRHFSLKKIAVELMRELKG
ncbi:hypothetical protein Z042_18725 [Chania multitudinisentens RB-25]|uniref:HTH lysR-type domain-containing protein n=1 Tax=Chania multitudinisentens RB-25 TaxID=1441930 RepID=W0LKI5_9GAMM|nr:LysR family transcriptional regulator [Chania multitudinisentens]AHG22909.1 hypothetical protein Z042_18725 [Chania multitudinisentens RB-25]